MGADARKSILGDVDADKHEPFRGDWRPPPALVDPGSPCTCSEGRPQRLFGLMGPVADGAPHSVAGSVTLADFGLPSAANLRPAGRSWQLRDTSRADATKVEIAGDRVEVTFPDGTRQEIEGGRFEQKDARGRTLVERPATAADLDRLSALSAGVDGPVVPAGGAAKVEVAGRDIEVTYADGWREEIESGRYELKGPGQQHRGRAGRPRRGPLAPAQRARSLRRD